MKVQGLDGRPYQWKLSGHVPLLDDERERSSYHLAARALLKRLYPLDRLLEELPIPGAWEHETLYLDFYVPLRRLCVEVHGEQHYSFNRFFHGDKAGFLKSRRRDQAKREWCHLNGFVFVEFPFSESVDGWSKRVVDAYSNPAKDG